MSDTPYPLFSTNQLVRWTVHYPILISEWDVLPEETEEVAESGQGYVLEQQWIAEPQSGTEPHWIYLVQEIDEFGEAGEVAWYDEDQLESLDQYPPSLRSVSLEIVSFPEPKAIALDLARPLPLSQIHLFDTQIGQQYLLEWYRTNSNHPIL